MTGTVRAFAWALVCDGVLLLGTLPLAHYSLTAARTQPANTPLIALLLGANLLLLAVCLCGAGAWCYALFQSLRATHARVVKEATAMRRNTTVSSSTTPAN